MAENKINELLNLIKVLSEDNTFISNYIDKNLEILKTTELDKLDESNTEFLSFIGTYTDRNKQFQSLMKELNLNKIDEISNYKILNNDELKLISDFKNIVSLAEEKLTLYGKLLSGEINMLNKIKTVQSKGKIDFKL